MSSLLYALSGMIIGMILFQTSIIAPSVFKNLDAQNAGQFLRGIFPKLFIFLSTLGALYLGIALLSQASLFSLIVGALSATCPTLCYLIVPATNKAKDDGDFPKFKKYHTISVVLTLSVLIMNGISVFL